MILSKEQKDSISELINISFSKSAASLSELTGHRVLLSVPEVEIHPISDLQKVLEKYVGGEISTVHQIFNGAIAGDALLILNKKSAISLAELLTGNSFSESEAFNTTVREVIVEVGNILLNACLGMFGNLLKVQFSFSVPSLHLESLDGMLQTIVFDKQELQYALIVFMEFRLRDSSVKGYLVIVLGVTSLDRFLKEVEVLG